MAMKPVFKFLVAAGVCVVANATYAHSHFNADPYLGLEYKLSYTKGQNSWKELLPTNKAFHNGSVFAGVQFHDCAAVELGYTASNKNTKDSNTTGMKMFGNTDTASGQSIKLSYRTVNLDLNGQYPAGDSFAFLGTIGLGSSKPKLNITNTDGTTNASITTISGKSKMVPRVGVGAQYVQGMFGVRTRVMWEGTTRLRVNTGTASATLPGITEKPFKSSFAWTLGAFVRW